MPHPVTGDAPTKGAGRKRKKPAETAIASVDKFNFDGSGVARVEGKVTFIEGALPGEQVRFAYNKRRKSYDAGRAIEIITASPNRVHNPPCPYFGTCGGCVLQHLQADAQVAAKEQVLRDSFAHIGKVQPQSWTPPLRGPVWGYRRKARLGVRLVPKKGGILVGFREHRRSFITPLADCKILDARFARLLPLLPDLIKGLSCPDRVPQIEVAAGDRDAALVFRHLDPLTPQDRERLRRFGEDYTVQIYLQPGGADSVHPLWPEHPPTLAYRLAEHDVEILFAPTGFTQVNADVNAQMVNRALQWLDPRPDERVLDLFCGVGNFTLPLARRALSVTGLEWDAALLERARANAARNHVANVEFRRADLDVAASANPETADSTGWAAKSHRQQAIAPKPCKQRPATPPWGSDRFDKLLLDPPRSGAIEAIKCLPADGPRRIVYVSCYPATLARDSEYLVHVLGYRLESACIMDMFPHTSHAESMALFVR